MITLDEYTNYNEHKTTQILSREQFEKEMEEHHGDGLESLLNKVTAFQIYPYIFDVSPDLSDLKNRRYITANAEEIQRLLKTIQKKKKHIEIYGMKKPVVNKELRIIEEEQPTKKKKLQ